MSDSEINAMAAVSLALTELDSSAASRVIRWAADKYSVPLSPALSLPGVLPQHSEAHNVVHQHATGSQSFKYFAELLAAAQPRTLGEKVLVAAFWKQDMEGHESWNAAELQKDLKASGHMIGNITAALRGNIDAKPPRVIQLQKAGASRQGRKIYRLTDHGIAFVMEMLSRERT